MEQVEISKMEDFLRGLHHLSENTRRAYRRDLEVLLDYCKKQGVTEWQALDGRQIQGFIAARHRQGIGGRSLQRHLSAIRLFFKYLVNRNLVARNPAQGIVTPRAPKKLPRVLDVDQSQQLVEIDNDDPLAIRDRAIFELVYSSGLRLAELTGLNLDSVDMPDAIVTVTGKGGKTRRVPVGTHALKALNVWRKLRGQYAKDGEVALFVSRRGTRITPRSVQLRLREWAIKQGLATHVNPHMLRHAFATHILESSGDLRAVQELLGHADISTTQVYTHLDFQHLANIYDQTHPRAKRRS